MLAVLIFYVKKAYNNWNFIVTSYDKWLWTSQFDAVQMMYNKQLFLVRRMQYGSQGMHTLGMCTSNI